MNQAVKIFGGTNVITGEQLDIAYAHTREEIIKLLEENPDLFDPEESRALGGEEFRQQLRQVMANPTQLDRVRELPWGSGSGFHRHGGTPGWIFCARVADHTQPFFRFVPADPDTLAIAPPTPAAEGPDRMSLEGSAIACLTLAQPFPDIERSVPDALLEGVFDAWDVARADIASAWDLLTTPTTVPPVPKQCGRSLCAATPTTFSPTLRSRSERAAAVELHHDHKLFRRALNEGTPAEQIEEIRRLVDQFALTAPLPLSRCRRSLPMMCTSCAG